MINSVRRGAEAHSAMYEVRNVSRTFDKGSRPVEVILTCRKQWLPFDVKIIPTWFTEGDRLGHPRQRWIVNVPSLGDRNAGNGTADVGYPE